MSSPPTCCPVHLTSGHVTLLFKTFRGARLSPRQRSSSSITWPLSHTSVAPLAVTPWPQSHELQKEKESEVAQSCLTLCDPMDCSLPDSSVHGIFQARYWSGLSCPPPGDLPDPGIKLSSPVSPTLQVNSSPTAPSRKPNYLH